MLTNILTTGCSCQTRQGPVTITYGGGRGRGGGAGGLTGVGGGPGGCGGPGGSGGGNVGTGGAGGLRDGNLIDTDPVSGVDRGAAVRRHGERFTEREPQGRRRHGSVRVVAVLAAADADGKATDSGGADGAGHRAPQSVQSAPSKQASY
eukprot:1514485-Prymnesium_polylepis.1